MINEYYGTATTPTEDFLAHYGIKGMKWGVRKAIASGNSKKLGRQYAKAQKKLAKLEKRANNRSKYVKRAAALGAGAGIAGAVAATGTHGIKEATKFGTNVAGGALRGVGVIGAKAANAMRKAGIRGAGKIGAASTAMYRAGLKTGRAGQRAGAAIGTWGNQTHDVANYANRMLKSAGHGGRGEQIEKALNKAGIKNVSNNALVKLGAGAIGAGLGAGAAYNAYRAATTKRAAKKAAAFRAEMNKAFAGTQYANGGRPASQKKRRRK